MAVVKPKEKGIILIDHIEECLSQTLHLNAIENRSYGPCRF